MQNSILKKIIALSVALVILFSSVTLLIGCEIAGNETENGSSGGSEAGEGTSGGGSGNSADNPPPSSDENYHDKIIVPEYKNYPRATVSFKDVVYKRPDYDAARISIDNTISVIKENAVAFESQIISIESIESICSNVLTMHSLSNVYNSKDTSNKFWNDEFAYNSEEYPSFAQKMEDIFVAAANSPHAQRFEDEYFGEGLIERYKDGGKYTDEMVSLMETEASLEADYSSISTASIEITFKGKVDTVKNHIDYYRELYGATSKEYNTAYTLCMQEYEYTVDALYRALLVELIKTRKLIAAELGDESYIGYAYESSGRDYTPEEMSRLLDDISEFAVPVFLELYSFVFYPYFYPYDESKRVKPTAQSLDTLVNGAYNHLSEMDSELADIYRYMLQFGLFDIEKNKENRQEGAYTAYLHDYEAPYMFMNAEGNITDYSTLFHEFGHFADYYVNLGSEASLDQSEVSSQGLEYIMLHFLEGKLSKADSQYMMYNAMFRALETLLYQGFYARFEQLAYALSYEEITEKNLNSAVAEAAEQFALNADVVNDISYVFIPHVFLYPFYVQSYCTSIIPSLELYFMEDDTFGSGLAAYKRVINRASSVTTFEKTLKDAGLSSPFERGVVRDVADKIHFAVLGFHFYDNDNYVLDEAA